MFTIRDWTLKEQHNLSVIALSSVTGFVVTLFFLNSTGITDINARMAVTLSGMFFAAIFGFREFHFQEDPLVSDKLSIDLTVILFALLTVASLVYAGYDHFNALFVALPVILLLLLPFYLVKSRRHSPLSNPQLTREDLVAVTSAYLRMAMPSYRARVKAVYNQAIDKIHNASFDLEEINRMSSEQRRQTVQYRCQQLADATLRTVLMETLRQTDLDVNDQRILIRAGYRINQKLLDEGRIDRDDFNNWQKTLQTLEERLPKSLQDIAR